MWFNGLLGINIAYHLVNILFYRKYNNVLAAQNEDNRLVRGTFLRKESLNKRYNMIKTI